MLRSITRYAQRPFAFLLSLGLAALAWAPAAHAQAIRSPEDIKQMLTIEKVSVQDGTVAGEIHNLSPRSMRDVQLFIRHTWLWDNEFHPGAADPGTSVLQTVQQEIAPGGTARFNFSPSPPLPKTAGGRFITTVAIAGFTEVIPQTR